jgi:hypothetical protein
MTEQNLDELRELNYAQHDPQFEPDPDEYIPEKEERYIDALCDLRIMIEDCQTQISHIKDTFRTRKVKGIETILEKMIEDIDKLISKGL